jgi:hypothetical protein
MRSTSLLYESTNVLAAALAPLALRSTCTVATRPGSKPCTLSVTSAMASLIVLLVRVMVTPSTRIVASLPATSVRLRPVASTAMAPKSRRPPPWFAAVIESASRLSPLVPSVTRTRPSASIVATAGRAPAPKPSVAELSRSSSVCTVSPAWIV